MQGKRNIQRLLHIIAMMLFVSCSSEQDPVSLMPYLYVDDACSITRTSASVSGKVDTEGRGEVTSLCFRYGTTTAMQSTTQNLIANPALTAEPRKDAVTAELMGLIPSTTYYYCLEGSNGRSTARSETRTFITCPNEKPTLSECQISGYGPKSVILTFRIIDDGGEPLTAYGCYLNDERVESQTIAPDGKVKMRVSGLASYTDYQLSAFATNKLGESRTASISFSTTDAVMLSTPGDLQTLIGDDRYTYDVISLSGSLNGDDIRLLRDMMGSDIYGNSTSGRLRSINLVDARIVAGGGSYAYSRFTQDDVISYGMFADCKAITDVKLPETALTIEKEAFRDCHALRSILIPSSVISVTPSSGCTSLQQIDVVGTNSMYQSVNGVLLNTDATSIVWFPMGKTGDYTLPSTIRDIGPYAFRSCSVTRFVIPEGITAIGMGAFMDSAVEEVGLPSTLRAIPTSAFQHCSKLKVVRLGGNTELLSDYVFDGCPLTDIYISAPLPPVCSQNTFAGCADVFNQCRLHVPSSSIALYRNAKVWSSFYKIDAYDNK